MNNEEPSSAVVDNHVYLMPTKMIKSVDDMVNWENSEAYFEILGFIYTLSDSVHGKTNKEGSEEASQEVNKVCDLLDILDSWIDEYLSDEMEAPKAFRSWYTRVREEAISLLQNVVPTSLYRAVPEIMVYLIEGFGNAVRVAYGTGHELYFIMFLCSLFKIAYLKPLDAPAAACKIFVRYLEIVRKLQTTYSMKSVGSMGVWSLDDYQFVPFILGSAQLSGQPLDPTSILKEKIVNEYADEYMFFGCIKYINAIKSGPFAEHSNQLWSISGVSNWSNVYSGLVRMYRLDILCHFPVVKQVYFGSIFTMNPAEQGSSVRRWKLSSTNLSKSPTYVEFSEPEDKSNKLSMEVKYIEDTDKETSTSDIVVAEEQFAVEENKEGNERAEDEVTAVSQTGKASTDVGATNKEYKKSVDLSKIVRTEKESIASWDMKQNKEHSDVDEIDKTADDSSNVDKLKEGSIEDGKSTEPDEGTTVEEADDTKSEKNEDAVEESKDAAKNNEIVAEEVAEILLDTTE